VEQLAGTCALLFKANQSAGNIIDRLHLVSDMMPLIQGNHLFLPGARGTESADARGISVEKHLGRQP